MLPLPLVLLLVVGCALRVTCTQRDGEVLPTVMIDDALIENADSDQFLGMHLDRVLTWEYHINKTCTKTEVARQVRSDVRTMMDKMDPNFWPTRGRRSSTSSEETPPPFWAHRGRSLDDLEATLNEQGYQGGSEEVAPPFWAHRGREAPPLCPDRGTLKYPLSAEEPRWVMFNRRDAEVPGADDALWISQGPHGLDGLTSREQQFWVSRGKKLRSEKKDTLRGLSAPQEDFYPSRGKRSMAKPTSSSS